MTKSKKRDKARQLDAQKAAQSAATTPDITLTTILSRSKVLTTPELLELIFLSFDIPFLVTIIQRVSKFWHAVIAASAALQQHLFLQPIPSTPSPSDPPLPNPHRTFNPLLYKYFKDLFPYDSGAPPKSYRDLHNSAGHPPSPAREGIVSSQFHVSHFSWRIASAPGDEEPLPPIADIRNGGARHYAFTRKGASWRRMLVSQPPPVRIARIGDFDRVRVRRERRGVGDAYGAVWGAVVQAESRIPKQALQEVPTRMVELKGGLRMGNLVDELWESAFGREYPWVVSTAWCAWRVPEEMRRELWKFLDNRFTYSGIKHYRLPETQVSRWADGADLVIGDIIPLPTDWDSNELCEKCMGAEGKLSKRCKIHLVQQQRYRCQDYRPRGVLSLNPRSC